MISFNEQSRTFSIQTKNTSYFLAIDNTDRLRHLYFGDKILNSEDVSLEIADINAVDRGTRQPYRGEYPTFEKAIYCEPCLFGRFGNGTKEIQLVYDRHNLTESEEGQTLSIILRDEFYDCEVALNYKVYRNLDLISKNLVVTNSSEIPLTLTKIKSGTLYPEWNKPMRLMHLSGMTCGEYQKNYIKLCQGKFTISNHRGTCASHQHVPFFAIDEGDASETQGKVWYGLLHWSGDFKIDFEQQHDNQLVVSAGVNDFDCEITLKDGESFETPLFTIGFSDGGYQKMSEMLYDYQYDILLPQNRIKNPFPIIYNTWYPYLFDVDEQKCLGFIEKAKKIGAELFVIDDGWFAGRKDDSRGLGDWWCDKDKFPNGLKPIADKAHKLGMLFGLWVEPEMVNPESKLFKEHPEWILYSENREKTVRRNQCVLNLAREDVMEFVWQTADKLITEFDLDYLKWDMNTYFTETSVADKDFRVKYTKNLYEVWRRINEKYPHVLLENCAAGGGRADYGMAPFADRINRSDDSDPVDVLKIHEGFSYIFLPRLAGGAGNISQSPNHLNSRITPLEYRAHLGMTGCMSVGVNILESDDKELENLSKYISEYKSIRNITHNAYMYRLSSPYDGPLTIWQYLGRDRKNSVVFVFANGLNYCESVPRVKLQGLDKNKKYRISGERYHHPDYPGKTKDPEIMHGDALMNFGIKVEPMGDYYSCVIKLEEI